MAESDIFVSNDIALDVDFGEIFVVDQGVIYKVIAKKYSSGQTYAVGDYVSHLEKLYRCITAVETAEAFDEEKWTEVFLADEVQIANNNIALKANAADLAAVATSGDYSDLSNTPNLATVATSGSYDDLTDKPTIPAAQVQADYGQTDNTKIDYIKNKPNLATVATSGDYTDLTNKPTIPAAQVNSDWEASSGVAQILNKPNLAAVATSGDYSDLSNAPELATVATSGDYTDLTNKPTIPAAQVNSDWNASSGVAQILNKPTIPDGLADLTDDVNITSPSDGQVLKYDGTTSKWVNGTGGGGGAQIALTQVQYNALVQAGTVDPKIEYFITDGIPYSVAPWTDLTATLAAGQTSLVFSNAAITTDSTIEVFVNESFCGVNPTAITLVTGSVTLTFPAQTSNMPIKVRVS